MKYQLNIASYFVDGTYNNEDTGEIIFWIDKQLLETQTTVIIDSSHLHCGSETIDDPCTLSPGLTWRRLEEMKRKSSVSVKA